jgi:methyl-accepting chemotaxis protein
MPRDQLAEELAELSSRVHSAERELIACLYSDLLDDDLAQLDRWSSVNLWESLNPNRVLGNREQNRTEKVLRDATSVLVFAPIALTWLTLWMASDAFSKYLDRYPESESTFFELWQSGFSGYLDPSYTFGSYVLKATIAILLMIFLFVAQNRYSDHLQQQQERSFDDWNRFVSRLDLELSVVRSENPQKLEGLLEQTATELRGLMTQGHALVLAIKDEVGTIQDNIDAVKSASNALSETISTISNAQIEQANTFKNIHASMERIGIEVSSIPKALESAIVESFSVVNDSLEETTTSFTGNLAESLQAVKRVMESLSISQQTYIVRGDEISLRLAEILSEIPGMKGRLEMQTMSSQADFSNAVNAKPENQPEEVTPNDKA